MRLGVIDSALMQPSDAATPSSAETRLASDQAVWDEFAALLDGVRQQATVHATDNASTFYQDLVAQCVDAIAATAGSAWQSDAGVRRRIAHAGDPAADRAAIAEREAAISRAADTRQPQTHRLSGADERTLTQAVFAIGSRGDKKPVVLELVLPGGRGEAYYDAATRLLDAVAETAALFETRRHTHRLEQALQRHAEAQHLAEAVTGDLRLAPTAMRVVNEVASSVGADRVAIVLDRRVAAVSGVHRVDQRGPAANVWRRLSRVAPSEPVSWPDGGTNDEVLAAEIDRCVDVTHARVLHLTQVQHSNSDSDDHLGLLIAEWFDTPGDLSNRLSLHDAAKSVAPALEAATKASRLGARRIVHAFRKTWVAAIAVAALLGGLTAAAVLVPVQHTVSASGVLAPVVQRGVFAPRDATVARLHVVAGQRVEAGQLLADLSDPQSLIEIEQLNGEIRTLEEQHAAASALRLSGDRRESDAAARLRLAAEQQRLAAQLEGLRAERDLLLAERTRLRVTSPIDGVVTTWEAETLLAGKPVARGELLLTIADDRGDWRLELETPEDRFDLIQQAITAADTPLRVVYETQGPTSDAYEATLTQTAPSALVETDPFGIERRWIALVATPNDPVDPLGESSPTPGIAVRGKIYCGERSLGYVALHDAWRTLTRWWRL